MKVLLLALCLGLVSCDASSGAGPSAADRRVGCSDVAAAFLQHQSSVWLTLDATVQRTLPDEQGQYLHQRFIVQCPTGQTVLIVNDVSIGQRVPVRPGEMVIVRGQYIWNDLGGLVHFTHHDPAGGEGGWIELGGKVYSLAMPALQ